MGQSASNHRRRPPPPPPPSTYPYPPPPPPYHYHNPGGYTSTPQPQYYAPNPNPATVHHHRPPPPPPPPPPPFVEHQQSKTVKNAVNVHGDTLRLEVDEHNPDHHLVSFTFDALTHGSVTIHYFAKEGSNCSLNPVYPDMYVPTKVPFQKGSGQKFRQPSGSGIDLGFFELDDLLKPLNGDIFPLVIYAEAYPPDKLTNEQVTPPKVATNNAQITQAVLQKHLDGSFKVKATKQLLWFDGERYELEKIFGLANSTEAEHDGGGDMGKECVVCLSEPRDTAVFPCLHLCMCSGCAKEFRLQSNTCPICRQPVEKLMEIKVNDADR